MKKGFFIGFIFLALGLGMAVANAGATLNLSFDDPYFVGRITPNHPSNPANEIIWINKLITLGHGQSELFGNETLVRSDNFTGLQPGSVGPLPNADAWYILAKYAAGSAGALIWYVGSTDVDVPDAWSMTGPPKGLSHIDIFATVGEGIRTTVPEPATMLLVGSGMIVFVALRKRFKA